MINELSILLPAFVLSLLMMMIHVPLGQEVLKRGVVFADLSLAQLAATGAVIAGLADLNTVEVQSFALLSALCGALFFNYIERHHKNIAEAVIGCTFVLSATSVLLVLSAQTHGGEHINDILSGQLLFVSWKNVFFAGTVFLFATIFIYRFPDIFSEKYFYVMLAVIVTTSVQMCGVYMVFASLVFPAAATFYVENKERRRILEYAGESSGIFFGLVISYFGDYPAGPAIVWSMSATCFFVFFITKKQKNIACRQKDNKRSF